MLLNAIDAREKAKSKISKETEIQLLEAEKSINEAIDKGQTSCWCYKYLSNQATGKLYELGYKVKDLSCQREGTMFEISW